MSTVMQESGMNEGLTQQVIDVVRGYLDGSSNKKNNKQELYNVVMQNIEAPLFRTVMEMTRYNQSQAARVLGVSRGTLRTKLKQYFGDEFIGTR